jgi:hypothetical protein
MTNLPEFIGCRACPLWLSNQLPGHLPGALKMPILLLFTALSYKMHDEKEH